LFRSAHLDKEDTVIVADVSFGDIFWSVLWFFFLFIWIMILFHVFSDLFRDHSVSGVEKTALVLHPWVICQVAGGRVRRG
jgi:hypothetical protein